MPSEAVTASSALSVKNGLRVISSAIVAYAAAYRNAAFAGPAPNAQIGNIDPAAYSAPYDEGCSAADVSADVRCVVVRMDHLRRLPLDRTVETLLIGNPAIADATMISTKEAVVTAKSVGTTNMIFLDEEGRVIADLAIVVRESDDRRVTLRRGPDETASYQCAPRCERTLSLTDSTKAHTDLSGAIGRETSMSSGAAASSSTAPSHAAPAGGMSTSTVPQQ